MANLLLVWAVESLAGYPESKFRIEGGHTLPVEQIVRFHKKIKRQSSTTRRRRLRRYRRRLVEKGIARESNLLGEGVRGSVYAMDGETVLKVAHSEDDVRYLQVEYGVEKYLRHNFERFGIAVVHTFEAHPDGFSLERPRYPADSLGENIGSGELSSKQLSDLKRLHARAVAFAQETGIGLDLKYDNLAWTGNEWELFDTGPRTSYGPYAFSLDVPDFSDFYRLWKVDAPRPNDLSIKSFLKQKLAGACSSILAREKS